MKKIVFFGGLLFSCLFSLFSCQKEELLPGAGTMTDDRDGTIYKTIEIGDKVWMAEDLRHATTSYLAGKHGYFYNLAEALETCPEGWHLSTDEEWQQLEIELGLSVANANKLGERGIDAFELKSTKDWKEGKDNTDALGLNIKPGGSYDNGHVYILGSWVQMKDPRIVKEGKEAHYWTSTEADTTTYTFLTRTFLYDARGVIRTEEQGLTKRSCRCVQD